MTVIKQSYQGMSHVTVIKQSYQCMSHVTVVKLSCEGMPHACVCYKVTVSVTRYCFKAVISRHITRNL